MAALISVEQYRQGIPLGFTLPSFARSGNGFIRSGGNGPSTSNDSTSCPSSPRTISVFQEWPSCARQSTAFDGPLALLTRFHHRIEKVSVLCIENVPGLPHDERRKLQVLLPRFKFGHSLRTAATHRLLHCYQNGTSSSVIPLSNVMFL